MRDYLSFAGKRFRVVFVEAEQEERFAWMRLRNRTGDGVSFEDFRRKDEQQRRMGLEEIGEASGIEIWKNDETVGSYLKICGFSDCSGMFGRQ